MHYSVAKDTASLHYAKAGERVQQELVKQVFDLQKQGLSKNEILLVLQGLDMEDIILNKLNLNADIDRLMLEYQNVLGAMEMTGTVTAESLTALQRIDRNSFAKQAGVMGELIKKEVARGVIAGATEKEIADGILRGAGGVLRADQAETLANTALNQFERNVTVEMAELDPANATYVYLGIIDDKTRDICLEMMSAGALTRSEIDSRYAGAFIDGGGFNCRHRWARETSVSRKLTDTKDAAKQIEKKGGFKKTPLTPQQQLEQNG